VHAVQLIVNYNNYSCLHLLYPMILTAVWSHNLYLNHAVCVIYGVSYDHQSVKLSQKVSITNRWY